MEKIPLLVGFLLANTINAVLASEADSSLDLSARLSLDSFIFTDNGSTQNTLSLEYEWYWQWNNTDDSLIVKPFFRVDSLDSKRNRADILELMWLHVGSDWELRLGIGKVFWGVSESRHLVDIINQSDSVGSFDGEEKFGQAMLQYSLIQDWGVLDVFILPYFTERTFPGSQAYLRGLIVVDAENSRYESGEKRRHIDSALRWSNSVGIWDMGVSLFHGTNREPLIEQLGNQYSPYYEIIDQLGVDVQSTLDSWLLKFEGIYRRSSLDTVKASTIGFEYTYVGFYGSVADIGVLMEYHWDSRKNNSASSLQNDLFLGGRLALNDSNSSEILLGVTQDLEEKNSYSLLFEANRRFGDSLKISMDSWIFHSNNPDESMFEFRQKNFLQFTIEYFY